MNDAPPPIPPEMILGDVLRQAVACVKAGDLDTASMLLDEAEKAGEARYQILTLRGGIHQIRHEWAKALPYYIAAREISDDYPMMLVNEGAMRFEFGDFTGAKAAFRAALMRDLNIGKAWLKLGAACMLLQEHAEALACYERCVAMTPEDPECQVGMATVLSTLGFDEAALSHYQEAMRLEGNNYDAQAGAAFTLLRMGRWLEGWPLFEARWRLKTRQVATWDYRGTPLFTGTLDDMRGKVVLLREEQGYGDGFHFSRYIAPLSKIASKIVLETSPPMRRIMETIAGVENIEFFNRNEPAPAFDHQTSLMSLPLLFGTTPETCPPPTLFQVRALRGLTTYTKCVGFCWAGGPRYNDPLANAIDQRRSMKREAFAPLMEIAKESDAMVQSLQFEDLNAETFPVVGDWLETAYVIAGLDLVITVDTAVAHLAGCLGVETWMLGRYDGCWRWMQAGTDAKPEPTPWYPTMKVYRQRHLGEWRPVMERVTADLREWLVA